MRARSTSGRGQLNVSVWNWDICGGVRLTTCLMEAYLALAAILRVVLVGFQAQDVYGVSISHGSLRFLELGRDFKNVTIVMTTNDSSEWATKETSLPQSTTDVSGIGDGFNGSTDTNALNAGTTSPYSASASFTRNYTACDCGFQYTNGICERCPFGFGGFNCEEPFLLALVVVSCSAGVFLLLILILVVHLCSRKSKRKETPRLFENTVLGISHHSEAMRLPRVRSVWSRGVDGAGVNTGFGNYIVQLGSPSNGSCEVLSPSEVLMRSMVESQKSQGENTLHGQQNLGFDSEEQPWPNVFDT
ncbi:uncharacterized protein LOC144784067 [Lissotriton helveticus]